MDLITQKTEMRLAFRVWEPEMHIKYWILKKKLIHSVKI